jgi:hypothetical protein
MLQELSVYKGYVEDAVRLENLYTQERLIKGLFIVPYINTFLNLQHNRQTY